MKTHNTYRSVFLYQGESAKGFVVPVLFEVARAAFALLLVFLACSIGAGIVGILLRVPAATMAIAFAATLLVIGIRPFLRFQLTLIQALLLPFFVRSFPKDNDVVQKVARVGKLDLYVMPTKRKAMWQPYKPEPQPIADQPFFEDVKSVFIQTNEAHHELIDRLFGKR